MKTDENGVFIGIFINDLSEIQFVTFRHLICRLYQVKTAKQWMDQDNKRDILCGVLKSSFK